MKTYYIIDQPTDLSADTAPGMFRVGPEGPRLWVFDSLHGRYALQLDPSPERPQFSYCKLGSQPIATGLWLGSVVLQVGEPLNNGTYKQARFICAYRDRLLVKANAPDGASERLALTGFNKGSYSWSTIFYRRWSLSSADEERYPWFNAPAEIERMTPYSSSARWDKPDSQLHVSSKAA